jgi:hypothetical protein
MARAGALLAPVNVRVVPAAAVSVPWTELPVNRKPLAELLTVVARVPFSRSTAPVLSAPVAAMVTALPPSMMVPPMYVLEEASVRLVPPVRETEVWPWMGPPESV